MGGKDEAERLSTIQQIERRIDTINKRLAAMAQRSVDYMHQQKLAERFKDGGKVDQYEWNYEYSYQIGRRCFASNRLIRPITKAYKGTFAVGRIIGDPSPPGLIYPAVIWLATDEFTMRRLKGQL